MPLDDRIAAVTDRITERSRGARSTYLDRMRRLAEEGPRRAHLSCGNQAHAYAAMDAANGRLRAYYSRDQLGSRCASLLRYRTPNGSSTAKPLIHALAYDLGVIEPADRWTDTLPVNADVPWRRTMDYRNGRSPVAPTPPHPIRTRSTLP